MKKKLRALSVCALLMCLSAVIFAACDGSSANQGSVSHTEHTVESWTVKKAADCKEEGSEEGVCTVCGEAVTRTIPKTEHTWGEAAVSSQPTCGKAGTSVKTCSVCGTEEETEIPPTGKHTVSGAYKVTKAPTYDEDGVKSGTCGTCSAAVEVVMPKFSEKKDYAYKVSLVRDRTGEPLEVSGIFFHFELGGQTVADTAGSMIEGGTASLILPSEAYTVVFDGLPAGYTVAGGTETGFDSLTAEGGILCEVRITSSLISSPMAEGTHYGVGAVLNDFTFTNILDGTEYSLGGLLGEKKGVLLDFYYVDCTYCRQEFPQLVELYADYGNDIAVICVNITGDESRHMSKDSDDSIKNYVQQYGLGNFYFMSADAGAALTKACLSADASLASGVPFNLFVDCEGMVRGKHDGFITQNDGAVNKAELRKAFEDLIAFYGEPQAQSLSCEADLPRKKF